MENQMHWSVMVTIVGVFISIACGTIAIYLRSIKQDLHLFGRRIDEHAKEIAFNKSDCSQLATEMARCKTDCQRQFVPAENFIRSEAYTRQKLDGIAESVAALHGSLKVVEKLPEIIGNVVKELTCKKD